MPNSPSKSSNPFDFFCIHFLVEKSEIWENFDRNFWEIEDFEKILI